MENKSLGFDINWKTVLKFTLPSIFSMVIMNVFATSDGIDFLKKIRSVPCETEMGWTRDYKINDKWSIGVYYDVLNHHYVDDTAGSQG